MVSLNLLFSISGSICLCLNYEEGADHDKVRIIIKGGVWRNTGTSGFQCSTLAAPCSDGGSFGSLTLPPEDEILKAAISKYGKNVRDSLEPAACWEAVVLLN
jgi:hypothetical protein